MISRYNNFLEDRLFENVVNESMIYYTQEFKDALYKLRLKSKIAQDLIDVEYTDVKPDITFVGMSDKEGNFTFTQIKKAINSIKKSGDEFSKAHDLEPDTISTIYKKVEDGTISQSDVNQLYNNHPWDLKDKARSDAKIGKLVNKIFPGKYNSKEIEEFTNLFKKVGEDESNFILITGEDIRYWYNSSRYEEQVGELGNSCMKHSRCSDYFDIYVENPDVCRLLILKSETDDGKIRGRVLIWKINELEEGVFEEGAEYYMDRIYAIDDATKSMFEDYADKQGWLKRLTSRYGDTKDFKLGEMIAKNIDLNVKLSKWEFEQYPYMDTFKKLDVSNGLLINEDEDEDDSDYGHYYIMTDTNGGFDDTSGKWSNWFDSRIPEDDALWSEPLDDWIYEDGSIEVKYGSRRNLGWYPDEYDELISDCITGNWIHTDDSIYSEWYDGRFLEDDQMQCITWIDDDSNLKSCRTSTDTISDQDSNIVIIGDMECWEYLEKFEHDSDYISRSIVNKSERNGKYYFSDESIRVYYTNDGEFIKEDCEALGFKFNEDKFYWTDKFTYNYKMDINTKNKILKALNDKITTLKNLISGKQTRLVFNDDLLNDEEWVKANEWILIRLERRLEDIKGWI